MKNLRNLMGLVMAAIVVSLGFVSCNKEEDGLGAANAQDKKASLVITEKAVLRDTVWGKVIGDTLIVVHDSLKNDTVFKTEQESIGFSASIKREFDERKTTVERLAKLDFTFEDAINKQDGKMNFVGSQNGSDADGQNYTLNFSSEKLSKWGLNNVHFVIVNTANNGVKNVDIEKKESDSIRVKSTMDWNLTYKVVNVPNLDGQTFTSSINQTNHERYISYGDAVLVKRDTTMTPTYGIWSTEWLLKVVETYRVNGQDSVAPAQTKKVTLVSKCGIDKLEDAFVGSLEFNHNFTSEKWGDWYSVESADKSVSVQERRFERLGTGSNGIEKDKFNTRSFVTEQKATVIFAGLTWNIPATAATLTNVRHTFLEQDSDLDGYSMLKFVDDEIATYNNETNENEPNYKKLNSSCKLYLKLKESKLIGFLFDQSVKHSTNEVKVVTIATPQFDNSAEGDTLHFVLTEPETFKCIDNFSFEKVQNVSEVSGAMEKDGELDSTKVTKEVKNGKYTGTYTYYKYTQKYRHSITNDGETKWQHWVSTWYDRFSFDVSSYKNGADKYDVVKSFSASVEKDANHLTQSTSLSTEDLEVWLYAINGTFKLDNVERKDIGTGTITKTVIGENGWDESTKGQEHTAIYSKRWCDFIRYKSDGTKTKQTYTHIFNNLTGGSEWNVSAEQAVETSGNVIPLAPSSENRTDDFCKFIAKKYGYEATQDYVGAVQQKDFASFTVSEDCVFEVEGKKLYFNNPEHSINSNVKTLVKESEDDTKEVYKHQRDWTFTFGGAQLNATSLGHVTIAKSDITPDFDIEVGSIYASVSRPSNRNASDITAYTYLLVSKDGKKCLPLGIYHDVVTVGEITDMQAGFNSACYVKDQNKVVATRAYSDSGLGMMIWCGADGNPVDAASHLVLQGAGFNDRGNDWINHTGKYAPKASKKGNVTVVTFEGTNVSYTFLGWNVQ